MSNETTAIKQTLAAYCHLVDRGSAAEVAALFAEDAILRPYYDGPYEVVGRKAIQGWYAYYHEHFRSGVRHLKHMIMSALIEADVDGARSVSYLLASAVSNETNEGFFVTGTYNDTLVKRYGRWLFETRQIDVEFMAPQGVAVEQFPPLGFPHD
jgi:ketosteroid isomerase-like protein